MTIKDIDTQIKKLELQKKKIAKSNLPEIIKDLENLNFTFCESATYYDVYVFRKKIDTFHLVWLDSKFMLETIRYNEQRNHFDYVVEDEWGAEYFQKTFRDLSEYKKILKKIKIKFYKFKLSLAQDTIWSVNYPHVEYSLVEDANILCNKTKEYECFTGDMLENGTIIKD